MTEDPINNPPINNQQDEINLIALAKTIWNGRRTIIITTIIFTLIGLFIAIFTPKQYQVTSIMVPQVSDGQNKLGGLSSLAAMAGYNLNTNTGSELSPTLYPQIIKSIPFQKELMHVKLNFENYEQKISLFNYYTFPQYAKFNILSFVKKYTIGLPATIKKSISGKINKKTPNSTEREVDVIQLSIKERLLIDIINSSINLNIDQRQGYISITSKMPEAIAAAQLGQKAQELLQKKITEFKIEKAKIQLEFILGRYNEKKKEFQKIQNNLARFQDKNKSIITELDKTELERLQSEYQISFAVFTELAKQLENSRIQVKEETPVFSIIQPISVPSKRIKPQRQKILMIWIFLGVFIGIGLIFGKVMYHNIKDKWEKIDSDFIKSY